MKIRLLRLKSEKRVEIASGIVDEYLKNHHWSHYLVEFLLPGMLPKGSQREFIRKKAFEISYALLRVAAIVKNRSFAGALEANAAALLDAAYEPKQGGAESAIGKIEYLVRFGTEAGLIHPRNAELILKETGILASAAGKVIQDAEELPEADFAGLFSKPMPDRSSIPAKQGSSSLQANHYPAKPLQEWASNPAKPANQQLARQPGGLQVRDQDIAGRQSAIFGRIRQSGNTLCRFSDLQESLQGISERTLRYDLESLITRGLVERSGNGRNTFYRAKTVQETVIPLSADAHGQSGVSAG